MRRAQWVTAAVLFRALPGCGTAESALDAGAKDAAEDSAALDATSAVDATSNDALVEAGTADAGGFGPHAFWFAFHACNPSASTCTDPQNHRVYLATTSDFSSFSLLPNWGVPGSVPDVIRRGNTVYVYVPGRVIRLRAGATSPESSVNVSVTGLPNGFVDPSLYIDSHGRLAMVFLKGGGPGSGDPARCPPGQTSCTKQFHSATEVDGSDGTQFTLDPGDRISATVTTNGTAGTFLSASDPDVFYDGKNYVIYTSHGMSLAAWQANDLRGTYTQLKASPADYLSQSGGIGAGHFDTATSKYWTFVHAQDGSRSIIKRAIHDNLAAVVAPSAFVTILTGATSGLGADFDVESPSIAENK